MSSECSKYVEVTKKGALLADFDHWSIIRDAAISGRLPADFDQWDLAGKDGWTVGHEAAEYGRLPTDFDQWDLDDNNGWAVAHVAAFCGHLPDTFSQWGLTTDKGVTVLRQLLLGLTKAKYVTRWEKERPLCKTEADWEVFKIELPEIYQKYSISGCMPDDDKWEALLL